MTTGFLVGRIVGLVGAFVGFLVLVGLMVGLVGANVGFLVLPVIGKGLRVGDCVASFGKQQPHLSSFFVQSESFHVYFSPRVAHFSLEVHLPLLINVQAFIEHSSLCALAIIEIPLFIVNVDIVIDIDANNNIFVILKNFILFYFYYFIL